MQHICLFVTQMDCLLKETSTQQQEWVTARDGQLVLRSLIGPDRSLGNFWKSNKAVLPIFCGTTELVKDQKVVNFGLNLITQFRARWVFILPKPVFFAFFRSFANFASTGLKKRSIKAKF